MTIAPEVTWIVLVSLWALAPLYKSLECYILTWLEEDY